MVSLYHFWDIPFSPFAKNRHDLMQNRSIDFIRQTPSSFYTNIYELLVSGWMDISTHDTRTVVLSP